MADALLLREPGGAAGEPGAPPGPPGAPCEADDQRAVLQQLREVLATTLVRAGDAMGPPAARAAPACARRPPPAARPPAAAPTARTPHVMQGARSTRKEARQWLLNALAGLEVGDPATQRRRWARFLPGGAACRDAAHAAVAAAMLQLLFEASPGEVRGGKGGSRAGVEGACSWPLLPHRPTATPLPAAALCLRRRRSALW